MRSALHSRGLRTALPLCAGGLPALTFPAPALWWLAYVALVPWLLLIRAAPTGRRAAVDGWLGGTGLMIAVHHWLLPNLHVFLLVVAALLGLLWGPWGWLVRRLLHGRPGPSRIAAAAVLVPSAWLAAELVRSWQYLGGPWGLYGASQWQVTPALRLASAGGVWLVSWLLVLVNTALVALLVVALPVPWAAGTERRYAEANAAATAGAGPPFAGPPAGAERGAEPSGGTPPRRAPPLRIGGAVARWAAPRRAFSYGPAPREPAPLGPTARSAGGVGRTGGFARTGRGPRGIRPRRPRARAAGVCCAVSALLAAALAAEAACAWAPRPQPYGRLRVAVVQPGHIADPSDRFDRSARLTRRLAGARPDLVVWGESSVGFDLTTHPGLRRRLAALSARLGVKLLVNVDARRSDRPGIYKSSVLVGPHGPTGQRYDKRRLVPFGEYIPLRPLFGWATKVGRAAVVDRRRGAGPVLMRAHGVRFGPLVCFETAFPDMSRQLAADDAQLLVAQSSTSTFQRSWAQQQHASLAALRAAESGRTMVHATLTGVTAVYGPAGAPLGGRMGPDASEARIYSVPLASGRTLYVRTGDWIVHASLAALLAYAAVLAVRARDRRRGTAPPVHGDPQPVGAKSPTATGS